MGDDKKKDNVSFNPELKDEDGNSLNEKLELTTEEIAKLKELMMGGSHCSAMSSMNVERLRNLMTGVSHCSAGSAVDADLLRTFSRTSMPKTFSQPNLAEDIQSILQKHGQFDQNDNVVEALLSIINRQSINIENLTETLKILVNPSK